MFQLIQANVLDEDVQYYRASERQLSSSSSGNNRKKLRKNIKVPNYALANRQER